MALRGMWHPCRPILFRVAATSTAVKNQTSGAMDRCPSVRAAIELKHMLTFVHSVYLLGQVRAEGLHPEGPEDDQRGALSGREALRCKSLRRGA